MRFRVLGGVEAAEGGAPLVFARRRERCLLGLLLLEAGRVVPVDRLVDLLWEGGDVPGYARRTVHSHVARVRSVLARGGAGEDGVRLVTSGTGYVLHVDPESVDAHMFRRLVTEAGAEPPVVRAELLGEALRLWRGPVLGDAANEELRNRVGAELASLRVAATEGWLDALVTLGRHDAALPPLAQLTVEHPERERFTELRMTALYRAGRKAEALTAYESTRSWLADNLGINPTPALRQLHRKILRDEVEGPSKAAAAPAAPVPDVPAQLPADMAGFVGRDADLAALSAELAPGGAPATGVVIAVIAGTAGVGKTALAVHFGHRVADRFPDGQLYLNLRGHAQGSPMSPVEALTRLLGSLGVPAEQIPVQEEAAAGLYRSKLAGKRMLMLLDNAGSARQVRPLLPAAAGCLVLVTSRDRLTGLVASHGARRRVLDTLGADDARTLVAWVVGVERVAAEPAATAELARMCAYLPLALRMAAANLASRPQWTIAEYVAALRTDRLGLLEVDGDAAVEAAFGLSYARLPEPARRMFRLLGLVPGVDVTAEAAAALADVEVSDAAALLDELAAAHLIEEHRPHRYAFHDLLRLHAQTRAEQEDDEPTRRAASDRLYGWCLATTAHAAHLGYAQIVCLPATREWAARATTRFAAPADAVAWLDAERANLTASVATAAHGPRHIAWLLADALRGYFNMRTYLADWLVCANAAAHAAEAATDLPGQAAAQISIAQVDRRRSRLPEAVASYRAALALCERADWAEGAGTAHNNLGTAYLERGELKQARHHLRIAMGIYRRIGDLDGESTATSNLGVVSMLLGALRDAETYLLRAAGMHEDVSSGALALATENLGDVCRLLGKYDEALRHAEAALAVQRTVGNPVSMSAISATIAQIHRDAGRLDAAFAHARTALHLGTQCASPRAQADAGNTVGSVHTLVGEFGQAVAAHRRALRISREATVRYPETTSLLGLAAAHQGLGALDDALRCVREALAIARAAEYRLLEGDALIALGTVTAARGDRAAAQEYAREALAIHQEAGHPLGVSRARAVLEGGA